MVDQLYLWRQSLAEVRHVYVDAKTFVVRQVIADVIWIFVHDYVVAVPVPSIAISQVRSCHSEKEVPEVEAVGSATSQAPNMAGAETAVEMAVLPGMIQVKTGIVFAGVMTHPLVAVHVRSIRMSRVLVKMLRRTTLGRSRPRVASRRRPTSRSLAGRKVPLPSSTFVPVFLGKARYRKRRQ